MKPLEPTSEYLQRAFLAELRDLINKYGVEIHSKGSIFVTINGEVALVLGQSDNGVISNGSIEAILTDTYEPEKNY